MASLNTLRTKYGIVLSVVIALVLVAFILGDQLSMRNKGNAEIEDNTVLIINGEEIKQSEYAQYVQNYAVERMNPDYNAQAIYHRIAFDKFLNPAYEAAGLGFTASDEEAMFVEYTNNILANDPTAITMSKADFENAVAANWEQMKAMSGGIDVSTTLVKAANTYAAGKYTNSLEVNEALRNANLSFDGHYVMLPYSAIEVEEATAAEIEAYNKAHRQENPNYGARTISFVRFDIEASEADKAAAEAAIMEADAAVKAANGDAKAIKSAVRGVDGKVGNYVAVSTLNEEEAKAIKAGENYGPVLNGNVWNAKYIVSKVSAPESITLSAITAESAIAADKLVEEINAVNGNLAEIEAGANATTETIKMANLSERDAEKFINAKVGDVFTYTINNKPAAVKVTELGKNDDFVLTADVNYEVKASNETYDAIVAESKALMNEAGKKPEAFNAAAQNMGKFPTTRVVARAANPLMAYHSISGIEDSRNIAIWTYDAKVGDKKSWTSKNTIYVCMVTAINNDKYTTNNESVVKREIEKDKKYAVAKETLTMESEGAESGKFAGVTFNGMSAGDVNDFSLVGAIARSTKTGVPTFVKGTAGVYLFVVDQINNNEAVATADVEAKRKEMNEARKAEVERNFENYMMDGIQVVDKRGVGEL